MILQERCGWRCEHTRCRRNCGDTCDREPCDEPCPKKIKKCGHPCVGFCGEPCPTLCRFCDAEELTEIFLGNEDDPDARYFTNFQYSLSFLATFQKLSCDDKCALYKHFFSSFYFKYLK